MDEIRQELREIAERRSRLLDAEWTREVANELERLGMRSDDLVHQLSRLHDELSLANRSS
jgi:hypothetical protein